MLALSNINKIYISSSDDEEKQNETLIKYYPDILLEKEEKDAKIIDYFFAKKREDSQLNHNDEILYGLLEENIKNSIMKKLKEAEEENNSINLHQ